MGISFFNFGGKSDSSKSAKERLQLVLVHDRADITIATMEQMKNDIIEVISRYIDIDPQEVEINISSEGRAQKLIADIPIKGARKR